MAATWVYRAEGNSSVVVANEQRHVVYRIRKMEILNKKKEEGVEKCNGARRSLQNTIKPNLCPHFLHTGYKEEVSRGFLESIAEQIQHKRPLSRLTKVINTNCHQVECLPDLCFVIDPKVKVNLPTFSVEIKPKKGFLCDSPYLCPTYKDLKTSVCRFCLHQTLKLKCRSVKDRSCYCPVDLFSGNLLQMKHALKCLMRTPQNNLRIFKDGAVVWSNEIKPPDICEDMAKYFPPSKLSEKRDDWNDGDHEYNSDASGFIECVVSSLRHVPPECTTTCLKTKRFPPVTAKICRASSFKSATNADSCKDLPPGCVLDLILQKQRQDDLDIEGIWPLYQKLSQPEPWDPHNEELHKTNGFSVNLEDTSGIQEIETKIQDYMEARTFMDCSVILAIQPLPDSALTNQSQAEEPVTSSMQCCHLLSSESGRKYQFSVSVIDLDVKPVKNIEKYILEDMNILQCYQASMNISV